MKYLINLLQKRHYSMVISNGTEIRTFTRPGVTDLYDLYHSNPTFLKDASLACQAISKGASALIILSGIRNVHAESISISALKLLRERGVKVSFEKEVIHITNREKSGWCPLELACNKHRSVTNIYSIVSKFVNTLRFTRNLAATLFICTGINTTVQAQKSDTDTLSILRNQKLDEVVVTGTRQETELKNLPVTVSIVKRQKLEQTHSPSLLPVLNEQVPGLFVTSRGIMGYGISGGAAGGISIRGLSGGSGQMMVLIDGHPQYMGIMGHPISDAHQSLMTERVEVVRGPASVLYGSNAMGGVINIVTRKMYDEGVRTEAKIGYGSYNTLQTEVTNRIHQDKLTSIVGVSYNRTDGHRTDMGFEQYSGYAKLGYQLSNHWQAWADVNLTQFKASQPGTVSAPLLDADQRITRGMSSFSLQNQYQKTSGALSFFYNWGRHKINDGYNASQGETPLDFRFNSSDQMLGISWNQSMKVFSAGHLTVGADWYHTGGKAWNLFVEGEKKGERAEIVDQSMNEVAGYTSYRHDLTPWLSLNAGIRLDYHEQAGTEWIPQLGTAIHLPGQAEVKLVASRGFRYPIIREMFMWGSKNPDLEAESLWNYEISFSQRLWDNRLSYGINLYYISGDNMIATVATENGMKNINTGEVKNSGIELQAAYQVSPALSIDGNYSYLHMENPVVGSPEHKLYAGINYSRGHWNVSTGVQYINGLYTSVSTDSPMKETFTLWDATINYQLNKNVRLYLKGENLLADSYEINAGYPMPKATFMGGLNIQF